MGTLWTTWNESALAGGRFTAGLTGEHGADFDMRWPNGMWPDGPAKWSAHIMMMMATRSLMGQLILLCYNNDSVASYEIAGRLQLINFITDPEFGLNVDYLIR